MENKEECEHLEIVKRMNLNNGSSHEYPQCSKERKPTVSYPVAS